MGFLKNKIKQILGMDKRKIIYDKRLHIRVSEDEKQLFAKYADLKGTDLSKLTRKLLHQEINSFIKQADIKI